MKYLKMFIFTVLLTICGSVLSQNVLEEKSYITDGGEITVNDDYVTIFGEHYFYPFLFSMRSNEIENIYTEVYQSENGDTTVTISFDDIRKPDYLEIEIDGKFTMYNIKSYK